MAGKPSTRTKAAMELVREGITPYAAAKQQGIHLSTIYRSVLYQEWQMEIGAAEKPRRKQAPDPRTLAAIELIRNGESVISACAKTGIHRVTIYESRVYRAMKAEQKEKA